MTSRHPFQPAFLRFSGLSSGNIWSSQKNKNFRYFEDLKILNRSNKQMVYILNRKQDILDQICSRAVWAQKS